MRFQLASLGAGVSLALGFCFLGAPTAHAQYQISNQINPMPYEMNSGRIGEASNQIYTGPMQVPIGSINRQAPMARPAYPFNGNLGGMRYDTRLDPYRIRGAYGPLPGFLGRDPRFDDRTETIGYKLQYQRYRQSQQIREGVQLRPSLPNNNGGGFSTLRIQPMQFTQDARLINNLRTEVELRGLTQIRRGPLSNGRIENRPLDLTRSTMSPSNGDRFAPRSFTRKTKQSLKPRAQTNEIRINLLTGPIFPEQEYYQSLRNVELSQEAEALRNRIYQNPASTKEERESADKALEASKKLPCSSGE